MADSLYDLATWVSADKMSLSEMKEANYLITPMIFFIKPFKKPPIRNTSEICFYYAINEHKIRMEKV